MSWDIMKTLLVLVVVGVLITQLHAGDLKVTTPPGTEDAKSAKDKFMCADFLCNESDGDRCNDIEDLGGRVSVQSCEPQQEFCLLTRTKINAGVYLYNATCSDECDAVKTIYTDDPDYVGICCADYGCNCDGTPLPQNCSSSTPTIDHGSFTPNNEDFGDTRNGQCDTNYILSIDPCTIECQTNGKWSSHSCTCDASPGDSSDTNANSSLIGPAAGATCGAAALTGAGAFIFRRIMAGRNRVNPRDDDDDDDNGGNST